VADRASSAGSTSGAISGLRISRTSFVWTLLVGASSVLIGLEANSLVLVAFGAVGAFDALGSATLMVHFRHVIRHERASDKYEKLALTIITAGMAVLGIGTASESLYRLVGRSQSERTLSGISLAAVSVVVLATLTMRKFRIAARIPSHALRADGLLSALGAGLALTTLLGTATVAAFNWWWVDPTAALVVAAGAIAMALVTRAGPQPD